MRIKWIAVLTIAILCIHCAGEKKTTPIMTPVPDLEPQFNALKEQGDREFAKMHLMGWSNAINSYRKALELKNDSIDIKEKLFFAYFLKAFREPIYFIDNSESRKQTHFWGDELNKSLPSANPFTSIAGFLFREKDAASKEITEEGFQQIKAISDTDYKYFLYTKYIGFRVNPTKEIEFFLKNFSSSNLRYFMTNRFDDISSTLKVYPDFIELLMVRGDMAYQIQDYTNARKNYLSIIEINPDFPSAHTGMGNVYYDFGLELPALDYYEAAVKAGNDYYSALFKKGVCLHDLGRYEESNQAMDVVGEKGFLEKPDAFYYKALNYFNLNNNPEVEANLKIAEYMSPDSFSLSVLAGLFYYKTDRFTLSRKYFEKAKSISFKYPESYYYLGIMDLKEKKVNRALENFHLAAAFFRVLLEEELQVVQAIETKNYAPELKEKIRQAKMKRLKDDARTALEKLEAVLISFKKSKTKDIKDILEIVHEIREKY